MKLRVSDLLEPKLKPSWGPGGCPHGAREDCDDMVAMGASAEMTQLHGLLLEGASIIRRWFWCPLY